VCAATAAEGNRTARELRVGDWLVDPARNEVRRGQESVRLEPKAIEVLEFLAMRAGQVIGREELLSAAWPGVVVGDDALTQAINKLRKALGDDAHSPTYIETISKRGYRLIAPVYRSAEVPAGTMPVTRGQSGRHFRAAVWAVVALACIAIAAYLVVPGRLFQMPWPIAAESKNWLRAARPPVVAVMPLSNLSGDRKRDYFSDGMTEDIINALGRFSALRVMSRSAVEPFKSRQATPQAVRDELGARYLVKGSVREADGRLRVAVELSDSDSGAVLWSDRYEGEGRDVFDIQDRIVRNVVGALALKVTRLEHKRVSSKAVESLEAYDLVLRARELIYRVTRETNRQARVLLVRAVELAPDYAEAYVTLAHAEYRRADQGWMENPDEGMRRVEAYARRALAIEDTGAHARAHAQLARVYSHAGNFDQALVEANRAVELNPSDPVAQYAQGSMLVWLGRTEEGIGVLETASRFDPGIDNLMLPLGYYLMGRYAEALVNVDVRIARNPEVVFLHAVRAATLGQMGKTQEAADAVAQVHRLAPFAKAELFGTNLSNREHVAKFHEGLRKAGM
jgi:adenylate cyclase